MSCIDGPINRSTNRFSHSASALPAQGHQRFISAVFGVSDRLIVSAVSLTQSTCRQTGFTHFAYPHYRIYLVMSRGICFGATITGGIQNVARLLPLLGTQQCEEQVGSALKNGRLHATVTPMLIFGSQERGSRHSLLACLIERGLVRRSCPTWDSSQKASFSHLS
jgi:hypothetical protein